MTLTVHDLSVDAVRRMERFDLAEAKNEPSSPIGNFDFHGCVCGVGSFTGTPPWELHTGGDELLHILAGSVELTVLEAEGSVTRRLVAGDLAIVPSGCWHRNVAEQGVTLLFMTPKDGNRHSFRDPRDGGND